VIAYLEYSNQFFITYVWMTIFGGDCKLRNMLPVGQINRPTNFLDAFNNMNI